MSLDYTASKLREIEERTASLRASGEVTGLFSIAGQRRSDNSGFMIFTLAPWGERDAEPAGDRRPTSPGRPSEVIGVRIFALQPNSLGIRGAGQGLQFAMLGSNFDTLGRRDGRAGRADGGEPGLRPGAASPTRRRSRSSSSGSTASGRRTSASTSTGWARRCRRCSTGATVGSVFIDDRSYDIKLTSLTTPVRDPTDLENLFLQTRSGEMVPMSTVVTLEERAIAPELTRESQMRAVTITAGARATAWRSGEA